MKRHIAKAGHAAYNKIPNPSCGQEAAAIVVAIPLLTIICFALGVLL